MSSAATLLNKQRDAIPGNTAVVTWGGVAFDLFDPKSWVFDIEEISHTLANLCRFGGHVEFYSVAEHSVRVSQLLRDQGYSARIQLIGLLHDATETWMGDIPRPIKKTMSIGDKSYEYVEHQVNIAAMKALGLIVDATQERNFSKLWDDIIKPADWAVFVTERDERPSPGLSLTPSQASFQFMETFNRLTQERKRV